MSDSLVEAKNRIDNSLDNDILAAGLFCGLDTSTAIFVLMVMSKRDGKSCDTTAAFSDVHTHTTASEEE